MPRAKIGLATLRCSAGRLGTSDLYSIRRVASSILARGRNIFVVPGEDSFCSFQVENVHWKCTVRPSKKSFVGFHMARLTVYH